MFKFLEITELATKLSISNSCLRVQCTNGQSITHALCDLNAIILATPAVSVTGAVLSKCSEKRIPIVNCNTAYVPVGVMQPLCYSGAVHDNILEQQLTASQPFKKRLWQAIVAAKIKGQDCVLKCTKKDESLHKFTKMVTSGDGGNVEAQAARKYWERLALFPKRDKVAIDTNILFNYVYAIIYSAFSRYICSMSMHPHIGIHHHNQYNPFCLASDLMEPYRPVADMTVIELLQAGFLPNLDRQNKEKLLQDLFASQIKLPNETQPLFSAIRKTVLSFRAALTDKDHAKLILPMWQNAVEKK